MKTDCLANNFRHFMLNKCTQNPLYHQNDTAVVKKVTRLQLILTKAFE